jgi:hypothetical protein
VAPDTLRDAEGANRRGSGDRRRRAWIPHWRALHGGRRRGARRDLDPYTTDWHEPRLLFLSIAIILLSTTDAILTLYLLESGIVREANPVMRMLLERDVRTFVNVKTGITASAMLVLIPAAHVRLLRRVPVRTIMHVLFGLYLALILYELGLLAIVIG